MMLTECMHEVEGIEEKALMALLQGLSFLKVFIHIFTRLANMHAPSVSTQTFYQFSVYFNLRNVPNFLDPKTVNTVIYILVIIIAIY